MTDRYKVVVFDFDGTLTMCDTLPRFIVHAIGLWRYLMALAKTSPWIIAYKLRLYSNSKAKERLWDACFAGYSADEYATKARQFAAITIPRILRDETHQALRTHVKAGSRVYIISASPSDWIRPWAETEGVAGVISTEVQRDARGCLTGKFATPNCYGPEKARRLLDDEPERSAYHLTAYGDSAGDNSLMNEADETHWIK